MNQNMNVNSVYLNLSTAPSTFHLNAERGTSTSYCRHHHSTKLNTFTKYLPSTQCMTGKFPTSVIFR